MATTSVRAHQVHRSALRIAAIYAVLAFLWIAFSDALFELLVRDIETLSLIQTLKGSFFVAATSALLWLLIKRDLRQLVDSEQRYHTLFEAIKDAVFVVTPSGTFLDANAAALSLCGYSLDELRAQRVADLLSATDKPSQPEPDASAVTQHVLHAKCGTSIIVEVTASPLVYDDEHVLVLVARDVSERRQAEAALQQSERRFRSLFELAPVGITMSQNGKTLSANRKYLSIFAYDNEAELAGTWLLDQIAPDCRDGITARNRRREAGAEEPSTYETIGLRKDGTTFPFLVNVARLDTSDGPSTLAFVTDITDRKHAEEQLRQQTSRANVLANISSLLAHVSLDEQAVLNTITQRTATLLDTACTIWLLSDDRRVLNVAAFSHPNPKSENLLQAILAKQVQPSNEGLHGQVVQSGQGLLLSPLSFDAVRPSISPEFVAAVERAGVQSLMIVPLRAHSQVIGTMAVARKQSKGLYTQDDLVFFQELADRATLAIENARLFSASQREIKERKQTERALANSEERFRSLSACAPIGICFADVHGQCVYTNPRFQSIVGLGAEATLGTSWLDTVHPQDHERVLAEWQLCATTGHEQTTEFRFKRLDGGTRWVRANYATMRSDQGARIGLVATVEDITSQLQAQRELQRVEQQLHTIISNAPLVLFAIDRAGMFTMAAGKGLVALGLTPEHLVGRTFYEVYQALPGTYPEGARKRNPVRRALRGKQHTSIDTVGGLTFETRWSPLHDADGAVNGVIAVAFDITERRLAEKDREKLVALVEHSSDTIVIVSFDGKILFLNSAAHQLLGISSSAVAKQASIVDYFVPNDIARLKEEIVPEILHTGHWFGEFRFRQLPSQQVIPVDLNGFLIRDHCTKQPVALACVARDITERKRAEETLRASEATNRALVDAIPDMMFRFSSMGVYLDYKAGKHDTALIPAESFIGKHVGDVVPPEMARQTLEYIELALDTNTTQVFEYAMSIGDELDPHEYEARLVRSGVDEVLAIVRDITDRKRMERTLQKSEALQKAILSGTTDIIFVKDRDGRYLLMNSAGAAVVGWQVEEIIGKTDRDLFPPQVAERLASADREVIESGRSIEAESAISVDGRGYTFYSVKTPYRDQDGVIQGVIGVSRDITERKRQEQIKDDFLALASHELKTPLATLVGYVHLLQRWSSKHHFGERADRALAAMQNEGSRLDRLINDLLDVSRIQTGRLQIHLRATDLGTYLAPVLSTTQLAIPDHRIMLNKMPTTALLCNIDAQRFEQVLTNLLTNAAKYSPPAAPIYVEVQALPECVEVAVRDAGIGIPAADLPFVFDRFYQVQRPARESRPGMGLGLFIAREIVRQHGGTLSVESQEHVGSRFAIRLPYATTLSEEVHPDATSTIYPAA